GNHGQDGRATGPTWRGVCGSLSGVRHALDGRGERADRIAVAGGGVGGDEACVAGDVERVAGARGAALVGGRAVGDVLGDDLDERELDADEGFAVDRGGRGVDRGR